MNLSERFLYKMAIYDVTVGNFDAKTLASKIGVTSLYERKIVKKTRVQNSIEPI